MNRDQSIAPVSRPLAEAFARRHGPNTDHTKKHPPGLPMAAHLALAALLVWTCNALAQGTTATPPGASSMDVAAKPASDATRRFLRESTAGLPWDDREDFELVQRGFVGGIPGNKLLKDDGRLSRDLDIGAMYAGRAPETVNPSLWR